MASKRELITVRQLRDSTREIFDRVARGAVVEVGAHRKAEVVITGLNQFDRLAPPDPVIQTLYAHLALATAEMHFRDQKPGHGPFHPGDSFGRVLSWLWSTGQAAQAARLVADLTAELRDHHPRAGESPRLAFSRILDGIAFSMPNDFTDAQQAELRAHLVEQVSEYLPGDLELS